MSAEHTTKFESREQIMDSLHKDRNLAGADMSGLDLSGIKLVGLNMRGADLHDSNLTKATLAGIDMSEVNLAGAQLGDARIAGASLRGANLRGAQLNVAKIAGVDLKEADLTGADLSQSRMIGVDVTEADFSDVNMTDARAVVNWSDAKVQPAELPEAIHTPPRWLPLLVVGILALVIFLKMRRQAGKPDAPYWGGVLIWAGLVLWPTAWVSCRKSDRRPSTGSSNRPAHTEEASKRESER